VTTRADGRPQPTSGYLSPPTKPASQPGSKSGLPGPAPALRTAAASRRVNRRLLAASVLVVALGGLLAFTAGQMLTRHTAVLAVARPVQVGATIAPADLTTAQVTADAHLSPIPATARDQVVGLVAQVGLSRGELLTRSQVGRVSGFVAGQVLVALPLKDGQFPGRGLTPGQRVLVVATPGSGGGAPASTAPGGTGDGSASADRGVAATVAGVGSRNPATELTVVDVRVGSADGVSVARLASTGNLALILLPAGG
jgi:hypothetical protein